MLASDCIQQARQPPQFPWVDAGHVSPSVTTVDVVGHLGGLPSILVAERWTTRLSGNWPTARTTSTYRVGSQCRTSGVCSATVTMLRRWFSLWMSPELNQRKYWLQ